MLIIVLSAIIVVALGVFADIKIADYLPYYNDKTGRHQQDLEYVLTIEKSDFENEVAISLENEGVIVSAVRFLGYIHKHYPNFVWYNGVYTLNANMSYEELCKKLQSPDYKIEYIKFTVPEGKNIAGISKIVEESGLCSAEEFLQAADSYDYEYSFIDELKNVTSQKSDTSWRAFCSPLHTNSARIR